MLAQLWRNFLLIDCSFVTAKPTKNIHIGMNNIMCTRKYLHINSSTLQLQINREILLIIFVMPVLHMFKNIFVISGRGAFGLVCVSGSHLNVPPPLENMNGHTLLGHFSHLRIDALGGGFRGCCYLSEP